MSKMRIYRPHTPWSVAKLVLKILGGIVLALIVLFIALFFYLRRYIVYTDDGKLRLDPEEARRLKQEQEQSGYVPPESDLIIEI